MKYRAVLNNYMLGTYSKGSLRDFIIQENRIDKLHTEVILDIPNEHLNYIKKLLGADIYPNRLQIVED